MTYDPGNYSWLGHSYKKETRHLFFYVVSTQPVYTLLLWLKKKKNLTHDEMLAELVADNLSEVSDIFSDSRSHSDYFHIRRRQNKTVCPLSD